MRRTLGFTTRASDETCIRPSEASCSELHFFLKESSKSDAVCVFVCVCVCV